MKTKIVVIGAGPGGYVAAIRAAQMGGDVTVIERENVGGTCLNWGCIPSKIYKQTADTYLLMQEAETFGIMDSSAGQVNLAKLQERSAKLIESQRAGIAALLQKNNIRLAQGTAHFSSANKVCLVGADKGEELIQFDKLIIANGTIPTALPFLPFDGKTVLSSNDIFALDCLPKSLTIIGGGVIGCEFANIMHGFGVEVNIIEGLDRLLPIPSVDAECSKLLLREMKKKKIKVELNSQVKSASHTEDGLSLEVASQSRGKEKTQTIVSEKVLVCIGRKSINHELAPNNAGVELDARGWIVADDTLQTTNKDIYAIGDCLGPARIMLAHSATTEAEIAVHNMIADHTLAKKMDWSIMPSAIFTMPEISCVGLSEAEAVEQYGEENIRVETALFRTLGKAQVIGEIAGFCKMICLQAGGKVLGVHMAGAHATDILGEATLAIKLGATAEQIAETIHAHPTLAEIMLENSFKVVDLPLHS